MFTTADPAPIPDYHIISWRGGLRRHADVGGRGRDARNDYREVSRGPGICVSPQWIAEELLRAEGFTDVRYVEIRGRVRRPGAVGRGEIDFTMNSATALVAPLMAASRSHCLTGLHAGCFDLFAEEPHSRDHRSQRQDRRGTGAGA